MKRDSLDIYDDMPKDMIKYLKYYGRHFNKKLCEIAVDAMRPSIPSTGGVEIKKKLSKPELDELLRNYNIHIKNNVLYDYVYVANMCINDFLGSSIEDDKHLCLYIKDVIDDKDAYDGLVFNRWYADMCRTGQPIEWSDVL